MGVGYQKFQAGSPDGYLDFGVISTPVLDRVVRSASKTIGTTLPTVDELYETYMMKKQWRS